MPSTKFKKRNLNRYRKIYPYLTREPRNHYCADREVIVEVASVNFSNSSSEEYIFKENFPEIPYIGAISVDTDVGDANVNVFISGLSKVQLTIETSAPLSGLVHLHIIYVAEHPG